MTRYVIEPDPNPETSYAHTGLVDHLDREIMRVVPPPPPRPRVGFQWD